MSLALVSTNDYLLRSGIYLTITGSWTVSGWANQGSTTPSGGKFRTYYNYGDGAGVNPYIYFGSDSNANNIRLAYYDGTNYFQSIGYNPPISNWFYWSIRYNSTAHTLEFVVNGAIIDTLTINLSTLTFVEKEESIGGSWVDFSFTQIGVWSIALSLHQISVQSHTPIARGGLAAKSFTTCSGWLSFLELIDDTGHGHDWAVTGAVSTTISPIITSLLPYNTLFDDSFDSWTGLSWQLTSSVPSDFLKPTLGCGYGELYTSACNQSLLQLYFISPPDFPVSPTQSATPIQSVAIRLLGALYSTAGNVPDQTTSISASLPPGVILAEFGTPEDTRGTGLGDTVLFILQNNGRLQLSFTPNSGPTYVSFASVLNAWPIDGLHHGIQVIFNYTSNHHVSFSIWVDNVSVLSGSYSDALRFGLGGMILKSGRDVVTTGYYAAFSQVQVIADDTVIDWPNCTDAQLLDTASITCALGPRPAPPTELSLAGMYYLKPGKTNDTYFTDLALETKQDFKIPNPYADTALLGDE